MNRVFFGMVLIAFMAAAFLHVTWQPPTAAQGHSATPTAGGTLFLGTGHPLLLGSEGQWSERVDPKQARTHHAAVALGDGTVLLATGTDGAEPIASAELYDPRKNVWRPLPDYPTPVADPAAVASDGAAVILGGHSAQGPTDAVWWWTPGVQAWRRGVSLPTPRTELAAAAWSDGTLIVAGGRGADGATLASVASFDPVEARWQARPSLPVPLTRHTLTALPGGRAVVVGGLVDDTPSARAWRLDPGARAWIEVAPMEQPRVGHAAVALSDDAVLVAGGDAAGVPAVLDAVSRTWTPTPPLHTRRSEASLTRRGAGAVLAGGESGGKALVDAEAWDPTTRTWRQLDPPSPMYRLGIGMLDAASGAVTLAIGLIGSMTLFLGLMKVAEAGGMLVVLSKLIRPLLVKLFPDVPANHPAMGAMILNMAANALGLANAATPFGIRAMQELDKLNPNKGTATNAMCLFLAINTSSVTLLPTGVIALRAATGSADPAGILYSTLFATIFSTSVAIVATKVYQRFSPTPGSDAEDLIDAADTAVLSEALPEDAAHASYPLWVSLLALSGVFALVPLALVAPALVAEVSMWVIPSLMLGLLAFGYVRGVGVYEAFVGGAKDGFQVAVKIIPYLVGILVAVAMFRHSGAMDVLVDLIGPLTSQVGLPAEALPMALLRPLSGSGAYGILGAIIADPAIGPDSYIGYLVSTFQGSTETTFYVIAVYFGAVRVRRIRHAMVGALTADVAGIAAAVAICWFLWG